MKLLSVGSLSALALTALALTSAGVSAQESKVLNVYNWSDYIAADTCSARR